MASILVVDDEPVMRRVIRRVLEEAGYRVLLASNGKVALRLMEKYSIDLLLTDLVMPEMEGIELIREVTSRFQELKIVAMSGGGRGDARWYLEMVKVMGVKETLAKPFTNIALLEKVGRLLEDDYCSSVKPRANPGGDC